MLPACPTQCRNGTKGYKWMRAIYLDTTNITEKLVSTSEHVKKQLAILQDNPLQSKESERERGKKRNPEKKIEKVYDEQKGGTWCLN